MLNLGMKMEIMMINLMGITLKVTRRILMFVSLEKKKVMLKNW